MRLFKSSAKTQKRWVERKEVTTKTRILGDKKPEKAATCSKSQERMTAQMFKSFS
jgi:hypothetical protein